MLSVQMGFSFVRVAVACAILERISDLEPSSETTAPRYLKLVTVPNFCHFTFISLWMPLALFVISVVFSALISILYLVQVLSRLSTRASSSCSSSVTSEQNFMTLKISGIGSCMCVCVCTWGMGVNAPLHLENIAEISEAL